MAFLPLLFEEHDLLEVCHDAARAHERRVRLFDRCCTLDQGLRRWYGQLESRVPKPLPSVIRTPVDGLAAADEDEFFVFQVCDYSLAATLSFYWGDMQPTP